MVTIFDRIKNKSFFEVSDIVQKEYFFTMNNIKHLLNGDKTILLYQYNMYDKIEKTFILLFCNDRMILCTEKTF